MIDNRSSKPIRAGRGGPAIDQLLFAGDHLFFAEANHGPSSQKISAQKTAIFFSRNVNQNTRDAIIDLSGFSVAQGLGKYLGSLPNIGRSKKQGFKGIVDRMRSQLASEIRHVLWRLPELGWWKVNSDGASKGNPGKAACGGLIRYERGEWV